MNIGLISTWFERGAAYVTKMYEEALEGKNQVYIYARGGEKYARDDSKWNRKNVTWGLNLRGSNINERHFEKWIRENNIQVLFFNEQKEFSIVAKMKKKFPNIKFGSYIDYYTEDTIPMYEIYDFIICNTQRHYEAFKNNSQDKYYVKWGTDISLYNYSKNRKNEELTFFHSMGMSNRKGTELLINAFINGELYKESKLIIHTQKNIEDVFGMKLDFLKKFNIEIINKTVGAPGLYNLGDVYVYPTKLDGLGLTIYEALSSGLPVITTDFPPMNEVINDKVGKLVKVKEIHSRADGYYWPLAICDENDLIDSMKYYIKNQKDILKYKEQAREFAVETLNFKDRFDQINQIFSDTVAKPLNEKIYSKIVQTEKSLKRSSFLRGISTNSYFENIILNIIRKR